MMDQIDAMFILRLCCFTVITVSNNSVLQFLKWHFYFTLTP